MNQLLVILLAIGPLTEPESLAIYNFTLMHNFRLIIAFHTQWYEIGTKFAKSSGYLLTEVPYNSSFAGFKDWFIQDYNRLGFTVEAGIGENPLPIEQFDEIYNDNLGILVLGSIL